MKSCSLQQTVLLLELSDKVLQCFIHHCENSYVYHKNTSEAERYSFRQLHSRRRYIVFHPVHKSKIGVQLVFWTSTQADYQ